jgi:hypothetical protein
MVTNDDVTHRKDFYLLPSCPLHQNLTPTDGPTQSRNWGGLGYAKNIVILGFSDNA